jgi:hypothetical protein
VYGRYWAVIVAGYPIIGLRLSAFNYQLIHIRRISLTPYPNPHPHTIGFGLSTSTWITKTLLHIRIIRIRVGCRNYPHHFHPYTGPWVQPNRLRRCMLARLAVVGARLGGVRTDAEATDPKVKKWRSARRRVGRQGGRRGSGRTQGWRWWPPWFLSQSWRQSRGMKRCRESVNEGEN